jgi:hypothetical protein
VIGVMRQTELAVGHGGRLAGSPVLVVEEHRVPVLRLGILTSLVTVFGTGVLDFGLSGDEGSYRAGQGLFPGIGVGNFPEST